MLMLNPLAIMKSLNKPIGPSYALDEQDVLNTKQTLGQLDYYKPRRRKGQRAEITPWPDTPMFEGIKTFQKDKDLKVDGLMKPGDPTEKALNKAIGTDKRGNNNPGNDNRLAAVAAPLAVPLITDAALSTLGAIAGMLGLTLPLKGDTHDNDESCNKLHYDVDIPTCNGIRKNRGKEAGARCFKTANERYAACLKGVPTDQLPPLDIWNN